MKDDTSVIVAIAICALATYGLVSLVLDIRRVVLAICRGVRDATCAIGGGIATLATGISDQWRAWEATRQRRRYEKKEQLTALQTRTLATTIGLLEELHRKVAAMEEQAERNQASTP